MGRLSDAQVNAEFVAYLLDRIRAIPIVRLVYGNKAPAAGTVFRPLVVRGVSRPSGRASRAAGTLGRRHTAFWQQGAGGDWFCRTRYAVGGFIARSWCGAAAAARRFRPDAAGHDAGGGGGHRLDTPRVTHQQQTTWQYHYCVTNT